MNGLEAVQQSCQHGKMATAGAQGMYFDLLTNAGEPLAGSVVLPGTKAHAFCRSLVDTYRLVKRCDARWIAQAVDAPGTTHHLLNPQWLAPLFLGTLVDPILARRVQELPRTQPDFWNRADYFGLPPGPPPRGDEPGPCFIGGRYPPLPVDQYLPAWLPSAMEFLNSVPGGRIHVVRRIVENSLEALGRQTDAPWWTLAEHALPVVLLRVDDEQAMTVKRVAEKIVERADDGSVTEALAQYRQRVPAISRRKLKRSPSPAPASLTSAEPRTYCTTLDLALSALLVALLTPSASGRCTESLLRHVLSVFCGRKKEPVSGQNDLGAWRLALAVAGADQVWRDSLARFAHIFTQVAPPSNVYDQLLLPDPGSERFISLNLSVVQRVGLAPKGTDGTPIPTLDDICNKGAWPDRKKVLDLFFPENKWLPLATIVNKAGVSEKLVQNMATGKSPLLERRKRPSGDRRTSEYRVNPSYPRS